MLYCILAISVLCDAERRELHQNDNRTLTAAQPTWLLISPTSRIVTVEIVTFDSSLIIDT